MVLAFTVILKRNRSEVLVTGILDPKNWKLGRLLLVLFEILYFQIKIHLLIRTSEGKKVWKLTYKTIIHLEAPVSQK